MGTLHHFHHYFHHKRVMISYLRWALLASVALCSVRAPLCAQQTVATHGISGAQQSAEAFLARRVTLSLVGVSRAKAVDSISRAAKVFVEYQAQVLAPYTAPITIELNNVPLGEALERVLDGTGLQVVPGSPGDLAILPGHGNGADSIPATGTISGRVVDSATGKGLSGVTIEVAGTKISAITQDSGRFTLRNVAAGTRLLTGKLFGYRPFEQSIDVQAGQVTPVRVRLAAVPNVLTGIVTTATGKQRKVEVGNDITTLNVDSIRQMAPVTSVTDLLATRVPGLTVAHTSGVPGAPARLRLRGVSSITGNNDPIVIVDGVRVYASQSDARNDNLAQSKFGTNSVSISTYSAPSPLDQIDPASIETIEVFKGPSASALYGSDAASGVIVITTKRGRAGPTKWSADMGVGVNWIPGEWPVNYFKFGIDRLETDDQQDFIPYCNWYDTNCTVDSLVAYQALNDSRATVFGHGSDRTASLSVSGGVPTLQYNLTGTTAGSVGYLHLPKLQQQLFEQRYGKAPGWIVQPDNYRTNSVSGLLTVQPTAQLRVTGISKLFNSHQQQSSLQQSISQLQAAYLGFTGDSQTVGINQGGYGPDDLLRNNVERITSENTTTTNSLGLSWTLGTTLVSADGGIDTKQRTDRSYVPFGYATNGLAGLDTNGYYGLGRGTSQVKTVNGSVTMPLRMVTTTLGINFNATSTNDFSAFTDILAPGVSEPTQFLYTDGGPTQSSSDGSTYGWYVEPRLNINSRFFAAPGFRLDGGSASGAHGGVGGSGLLALPKLDISWLAIDGNNRRGPLTLLRPRASLGVAGTQPAPTAKYRLYQTTGGGTVVLNDSTMLPGIQLSSIGNTHLVPETSRELEGGFDMELAGGRLSVTASGYSKNRRNAIVQIPVAVSVAGGSGFSQSVNIGEVSNTGVEVTTHVQLLERQSVTWGVGANLSANRNRLVHISPSFTPNTNLGIVPGYPLFGIFARPIVGFADANQDGVLEPQEILVGDSAKYVGESVPPYQMNVTSNGSLFNGRLTVYAGISYERGMTQSNLGALSSGTAQLYPNRPGTTLATQAAFVAASCYTNVGICSGSPSLNASASPIGFLQNVSILRFDELSVRYTLPRTIAQRFGAPSASIAVQGKNLGLRTNYRGADPDVNGFSTAGGGDRMADLGQLPEPRTWWLKLTLGN